MCMDFEADALIEQISRNEKKKTFGLIVCALFHQPKPIELTNFYQQLIGELKSSLTDDEKQSIYFYPIDHLHITIATLYSFKNPWPESPEKCLEYWKKCFNQLKESSNKQAIILTLDTILLSKAAGFFQYKDEKNGLTNLRQSIREVCKPAERQPALEIPNIIHTSFLRFIKKPEDPKGFEEKFHRICKDIFANTKEIRLEIDEVCLAFEAYPYMHVACDETHILDIIKCSI